MSLATVYRSINLVKLFQSSSPHQYVRTISHNAQRFSNKPIQNITFVKNPETGEIKKKKAPPIPKITLLHGNNMEVTTVEEAQKLAKRRDLKLVKIVDIDTKTQRPIYKLMTGSEYHTEDLKQRERKKAEKQKGAFKGEKVVMINQNISEHDLQVHINKILKWLDKKYEVRVVINGDKDNMNKADSVYSFLETNINNLGRIVQTRKKGSDIRFQVIPPKQTDTPGDNNDVNKETTL